MDRYGGGEVTGAAAVLEATQLCNTRQLRDMLACLGGIGVLLPFIAQARLRPGSCAGASSGWAKPAQAQTSQIRRWACRS